MLMFFQRSREFEYTLRKAKEIDKLTSYDHYFTAKEAVEMGLADGIKDFSAIMEGCV